MYIADTHTAIVTSGNLTYGSLNHNYEYGFHISDSATVSRIATDIQGYADLGTIVSHDAIENLATLSETLREKQTQTLDFAPTDLLEEIEHIRDSLMRLRGSYGETTHSIFERTIIYLLSIRPLATHVMHPLIRDIHPDLCDASMERIIDGVHFGKTWKHRVRAAQQHLKDKGTIDLIEGYWHLVNGE